jgi:hypothetical protein
MYKNMLLNKWNRCLIVSLNLTGVEHALNLLKYYT